MSGLSASEFLSERMLQRRGCEPTEWISGGGRKAVLAHSPPAEVAIVNDPALLADEIEARVAALPVRSTQAIRALRREYSRRLRSAPPDEVIALAGELLRRKHLLRRTGGVHRFFADELIAEHPTAARTLRRQQLEELGRGLASWDDVDCFACYLSGPAWRERLIDDAVIAEWAASADRWWRRAGLVSSVPLNVKARGGNGDAERTLWVCSLLIDDRDDMVVKALSWALRALAERDPGAVHAFVSQHSSRLAPRIRREVATKLLTGRKNTPRARQLLPTELASDGPPSSPVRPEPVEGRVLPSET
jgi:DNA alkylation repair enzyme